MLSHFIFLEKGSVNAELYIISFWVSLGLAFVLLKRKTLKGMSEDETF